MGFLNQLFGKKEEQDQGRSLWKKLESEKDLDSAVERSSQQKVLIFKHSTRCFISKTVLKNFEKQMQDSDKDYAYYFLDLLANRPISNEIESRFDVTHQSPQLIVLEKGKVIHNASHQNIDLETV
ncbi:bacillithiol system protein YtxJ [Epilithonimonas hungarica]|jgi:bacillithiol system protein YtxJ|uniref:bacillithiol system redox-active protein YtxJ n=1 Tax=Epilithonimonas hungarica TaxID=454006 RepID=UPI0012C80100|nr:bacillithiol system redox-active protein YtxJ [Epilithonimonas hungarica]MDP9955359.1 bacillithiol system protein YtxJ [Epilithonimonas hungarica]MPT30237.1 bacillithiol system redox-active protein YtxJ [Chryseobacterium sp.]